MGQKTEGDERVGHGFGGIRMFQVEKTGRSRASNLKHVWEGKKNNHISGTARRSMWLENNEEVKSDRSLYGTVWAIGGSGMFALNGLGFHHWRTSSRECHGST